MEGFVGWPADVAARPCAGSLEGVAIGEMFARSAQTRPDKVAVPHGDRRSPYAQRTGACATSAHARWASACAAVNAC
jgi:non-ribosomal peptide synthetase component E (peptide arylation enzyme)